FGSVDVQHGFRFPNRFYQAIPLDAVDPLAGNHVFAFILGMAQIGIMPHGANIGQTRLLLEAWPGVRVRMKRGDDRQIAALAIRVWRQRNLVLEASRPALDDQRAIGISQNETAFLVSRVGPRLRFLPSLEEQA